MSDSEDALDSDDNYRRNQLRNDRLQNDVGELGFLYRGFPINNAKRALRSPAIRLQTSMNGEMNEAAAPICDHESLAQARNPVEVIDLCNTPPAIPPLPNTEDDVFVASDHPLDNNVIDLCTPPRRPSVRLFQNRRQSVELASTSVSQTSPSASCDHESLAQARNPVEIIDLCNTPPAIPPLPNTEDDVFVASDQPLDNNVIDLCTPPRRPSVRLFQNRRQSVVLASTSVSQTSPSASGAGDLSRLPMCRLCSKNVIKCHSLATLCGHIFCAVCIIKAVGRRRNCPVCNAKVKRKDLVRLYL